MEKTPLLPLPEGMLIDQIQLTATGLLISVISTHPTSCCPLCSEPSSSIKSHYRRTLRDVPCGGRRVLLSLTVRKCYCRNAYCPRKVFAERFPAFVEPWARMTIRHGEQITSIGLAILSQRRYPIGRPFGRVDDSPDDPASHHGSA